MCGSWFVSRLLCVWGLSLSSEVLEYLQFSFSNEKTKLNFVCSQSSEVYPFYYNWMLYTNISVISCTAVINSLFRSRHLYELHSEVLDRKGLSPYKECNRRNVRDFGRVFLRSNYTDITQNAYIQSWTVTEIMAGEVWNFDSCYSLIDYQIHVETGRNMWFL